MPERLHAGLQTVLDKVDHVLALTTLDHHQAMKVDALRSQQFGASTRAQFGKRHDFRSNPRKSGVVEPDFSDC